MRCRGGGMARRNTLRALLAGLRCVGLRLDATAPPSSLHVTLARIGTIISCEVESLFAGEEEADWLKIGTENSALKFFSDST